MIGFADFEAFLKASFPDMTDGMVERFRLMDAGYRDWNAKINVISRKDIDSLYDHHVLHSLAIAEYLRTQRPEVYSMFTAPLQEGSVAPVSSSTNVNASRAGLRVLDLGTGGGFPGIPLAVMFPDVRFTLCDSVGKKTIVAREIANMLGLDNVEIVNARAESLPGRFDFVVSRAVASLTDFYPWVKGKYSQSILYLKGGDLTDELARTRQTWREYPISAFFDEEFFETKKVVYTSR